MTKRIIVSAALILIAFSSSAVFAQTTYSLPRGINLDPIVRRTFRNFFVRPYPGASIGGPTAEGFFPIGWSRDGKFAYYSEPVDEECGCYFAELAIVDLRSDKILWEFRNKPQERIDDKGIPIADDMRKLWARNEKTFTEKLQEHGIVQTTRFALLPATFSSTGKNYTARVSRLRGEDSDGLDRLRKFSLDLSSPTLGKKSLFSAEYKGDEMYVSPLDAGVAGVFKSPFENRAAVVMIKVQRGWEGPPHTVGVQIAGADLVKGFRR